MHHDTMPRRECSADRALARKAPNYPDPRERLSIAEPVQAQVADVLARLLADLGVTVAFGIVGGAVAPIADALARHGGIRVVQTRHESGAAFAATEASLASGRPTVVFATTGPGITNALTGLFVARREGAQVIFVSGVTPASQRDRWPLQESGPGALLEGLYVAGPLFHHATTIEHADQLHATAIRLARGLRRPQGFVAHVAVPTNVQTTELDGRLRSPDLDALRPERLLDPRDVARCAELVQGGPAMLWVGRGARHCAPRVVALAERLDAPVMCTPGGKGAFPETHPLYVGVTGLGGHDGPGRTVQSLHPEHILVLGTRLGEFSWGWDETLLPRCSFIHVDIDPEVPGRAYPRVSTLGVQAELRTFVEALLEALPQRQAPRRRPPLELPRSSELRPHRAGPVRPQVLLDAVQRVIVEATDAIVIADAGNALAWTNHRLRFRRPGRFRANMGWGCMGLGAAGVLGAAMHHTDKAVAIVGDGAMLMNCEISTAVQYGLAAVWIVLNDSLYGMVDHGMRDAGYRPVETAIPRTDFAQIARAMGADGVRVEREQDVEAALARAMCAPGPFVVDVVIDPDVLPPLGSRLDNLRAQGVRTP